MSTFPRTRRHHLHRHRSLHPLIAAMMIMILAGLIAPGVAMAEESTKQSGPNEVVGEGGRIGPGDPGPGDPEPGDPEPGDPEPDPNRMLGIDVSGHNKTVDWAAHWADGKRFAYIKATEGTTFRSSKFSEQYTDSYYANYIRGAYHFGRPDGKSGAAQADFFADHGGAWSPDGQTLPGVLDIEEPYFAADRCWGLTQAQMVAWIADFTSRYYQRTGRQAVIYTAYYWWVDCTGDSKAFGQTNPLWLAAWRSTPPEKIPGGWSGGWTFWQYTDTPLDQNQFAGNLDLLKAYATIPEPSTTTS